MASKLIVGLGNPGDEFKNSRHNIGFKCLDYIASKLEIPLKFEKKKSVFGKKRFKGMDVIVLKPQTFSNLSGEAVLYIASFLKVDIKDIFVVYDDITRNFGEVEIEKRLEKVSHNAIKALAMSLKSGDFIKCAIGIGPRPTGADEEQFYLGNFTDAEESDFQELFEKTYDLALSSLAIEIV
ncbi:MAG: aminoacyl-tRNA hydrolase [Spirochaetia bacterium]|nr:aminoacyl-tRNA hydrolase [Spirochaetia bacterium]